MAANGGGVSRVAACRCNGCRGGDRGGSLSEHAAAAGRGRWERGSISYQSPGATAAIRDRLGQNVGGRITAASSGCPHRQASLQSEPSCRRQPQRVVASRCRRRLQTEEKVKVSDDSRRRQPATYGSRRPRRPPGVAAALGGGGSTRREGALQGSSRERRGCASDGCVRAWVPAAATSRAAAAAGRLLRQGGVGGGTY